MLIPYGLDSKLRRWPIATALVTLICLLVFLLQLVFPGTSEAQLERALYDIVNHYLSHSGLELPEDVAGLPELSARSGPRAATAEARAELDALIVKYQNLLERRPAWRFGFRAGGDPLGLVWHMFVHGSWGHLLGNMWLLWVVGMKIEDLWGRWVFALLYLSGGLAAAGLQALVAGNALPMIGASGAIAALMGAFLLRLYNTQIRFAFLGFFFFRPIFKRFTLPAFVVLPYWFIKEGVTAHLGMSGNVATWAHLGGFAFGVLIAFGIRALRLERAWLTEGQVREEMPEIDKLERSQTFVEAGMGYRAVTPLKQFLSRHPDDLDALELLARAQRQANQDTQAVSLRAIKLALTAGDAARAAAAYALFKPQLSLGLALRLAPKLPVAEAFPLLLRELRADLDSAYAPKVALLLVERADGPQVRELLRQVYLRSEDPDWKLRLEAYLEPKALPPSLDVFDI